MPVTDVVIRSVQEWETKLRDVSRYTINVEAIDMSQPRALGLSQVQTVNAWRASLCAQAVGQVVTITWRDTKYGPEVLDVQPAGAPKEAA